MWGLLSIILQYLRYIDYAVRRNWIPVVDMQTVSSIYRSDHGNENAWEHFFKQPGGYSLADVSHARNIVIPARHLVLKNDYFIDCAYITDEKKLSYWQNLAQSYLHFSPQAQAYVSEQYQKVFGQSDTNKILGVYCRGTDYINLRPKNHQIQPQPKDVIRKAQQVMTEREFESIYLVTEDAEIFTMFKDAFGDKLLVQDAQRYTHEGGLIFTNTVLRSMDPVQSGLEYLANMKLLASLDNFMGGVTGGTAGMMLLRQGSFNYQYFWNLGRY